MTDYESDVLNLQLRGMMNAYDMSNLFELLKMPILAKIHSNRFQYLMKNQEKVVKYYIHKYNSIPNSGKVNNMYILPLDFEKGEALIGTALQEWVNWDTRMIEALKQLNDKNFTNLWNAVNKDLRIAQKWLKWFNEHHTNKGETSISTNTTQDTIPPMRQLMQAKIAGQA